MLSKDILTSFAYVFKFLSFSEHKPKTSFNTSYITLHIFTYTYIHNYIKTFIPLLLNMELVKWPQNTKVK